MPNFKIVVSDPKSRKAYQKEVDQGQSGLIGKKIGEKVSGNNLGLAGYELEITGGSDKEGFPMRKDVEGTARKRILLSAGTGFHPKIKGQRKRKSIRGNTISPDISQINVKVVKAGPKTLDELIGTKPKEAGAEEKPEEKKGEAEEKPKKKPEEEKETKEEGKAEAKPEEEKKAEETKSGAEKAEAKTCVKKLEEIESPEKGKEKEEKAKEKSKKPEKGN